MDIREHLPISTTDKAVHVTMPEHVQFQIPFDQCETFFVGKRWRTEIHIKANPKIETPIIGEGAARRCEFTVLL